MVLYRSSLLLNESCDFCPSNQYILVRVTPRCFRLVKMWCCQVSFLSRCSPRYLTWSSQGSCTLFIWTGEHVPLHVVNVTRTDLRALACILHFWSQICIAKRWVWSFWEATAGSLSVATTYKCNQLLIPSHSITPSSCHSECTGVTYVMGSYSHAVVNVKKFSLVSRCK
jgi:hypothetical protein